MMQICCWLWLMLAPTLAAGPAPAFEGKIAMLVTRGNETNALLYTVGPEHLRIEVTGSTSPHPVNIVELKSGAVTLVFPHNRSFVRLKGGTQETAPAFPGAPAMPLPPGIGPRGTPGAPVLPSVPGAAGVPGVPAAPPMPAMPQLPSGIGPQSQPGIAVTPGIPAMPMMPPMSMEQVELKATDEKKEILGFPCTRYELKQRGETMEIWATDKLLPFQPWLQNEPPRFGPRMIEEQWGGMLKAKKLFPLLVILKFEGGQERMRFEVKSVTPERITDESLFRPPADYHELQPLPF